MITVIGALGTFSQRLRKVAGGTEYKRKNRDSKDHIIVKISYNTENSPGDLRRLTFNPTQVKGRHLKLV